MEIAVFILIIIPKFILGLPTPVGYCWTSHGLRTHARRAETYGVGIRSGHLGACDLKPDYVLKRESCLQLDAPIVCN